jgi:hypothetical protein
MPAHLHQHEIDVLATRVGSVSDPVAYRHLDDCELCLRRLIDEALRLASVEADGEVPASALDDLTSAAGR